jgi:hypothetical protein
MKLTHHTGMALKDFEPQTKGDRLRVQWDKSQSGFRFKMIDWNVTGNTVQDQAQDLLYFGGHLYYFLLGRHLRFEEEKSEPLPLPPVKIDLGVSGWEEITVGSRQILQKLLHRDPQRRYQSAEALSQEMTWWINTLEQIGASDALGRLDRRLWEARPAGQYDRVLAIADLGLRLNPSTDARESFRESYQKANEELKKANWEPIARARVTLGTGAYEGAAQEFAQQVRILDPESKTARIARIYLQLSRAGALLKEELGKYDIRSTPEWDLMSRMARALVDEAWQDAQEAASDLMRKLPNASSWAPFEALRDLAQAGVLAEEAMRLAQDARPRRADADRTDWLQIEQEQIQKQRQAVEKLKKARDLASDEPAIKNSLTSETRLLEQRRQFLQRYKDADTFIAKAEKTQAQAERAYSSEDYAEAAAGFDQARRAYQSALQEFREILSQDSTQPRANIYRDRIQQRVYNTEQRWREASERAEAQKQFEEALAASRNALRLGKYDKALHNAQIALEIEPDRRDVQAMVSESQVGERVLSQVQSDVGYARDFAQMGNFEQAYELAQSVLSKQGQPLAELSDENSSGRSSGRAPFRLAESVATQANELLKWTKAAEKVEQKVDDVWEREDYKSVIAIYQRYEHELVPPQKDRLSQAQERIGKWEKAEPLVDEPKGFADLKQVKDILDGDQSQKAMSILRQVADHWLRLVENLDNWKQAADRLNEGLEGYEDPSIVEEFEKMLDLVGIAQDLEECLDPDEGARWPAWLSETGWQDELLRVVDRLSQLERPESWRALRDQANIWRSDLIEKDQSYLAVYLRDEYHLICEKSRAGKFSDASKDIEAHWSQLSPEVRNGLPADVQNAYSKLHRALIDRLNAEISLKQILQQVAEREISFEEARQKAKTIALPSTENVSSGDLRAIVRDLQKIAEMERLQSRTPEDATYSQLIYGCRRLENTDLGSIARENAIVNRVQELREAVANRSAELSKALLQELQDEIESQKARLDREPERLLTLYRQARWREAITLHELDEVTAVRTATKDILTSITDDLQDVETATAFGNIVGRLEQLMRLNNGVTETDESPPLPENVTYRSVQRPLGNELKTLRDEVRELHELAKRAAKLKPSRLEVETISSDKAVSPPKAAGELSTEETTAAQSESQTTVSYDAEAVSKIRDLSQAVKITLRQMKNTWGNFDELADWKPGNSLSQLNAHADVLLNIAKTLAEAQQRIAQNAAMQGLDLLYRRLEKDNHLSALEEAHDAFWEMPRQALQTSYRAMREALITALGQQVSDILDSPEAVETLQQRILYVPRQKSVALAAREAIREGVTQQAATVEADLQKREARRLWGIVMEATSFWSGGKVKGKKDSSQSKPTGRERSAKGEEKPQKRRTPQSWEEGR